MRQEACTEPSRSVATVLQILGEKVENLGLNTWQLSTLRAIKNCRTAVLGGHIDACDGCGNISISYNSCRNRHCGKCQGHKREEWMNARMGELLPVPYFHVVFTLPSELNKACMHQPKVLYDALFTAAWQTLYTFGKEKGLQMGMIALLHTWGQQLSLHPHLHCIVPGGGVDEHGIWKGIRCDGKFLFSVKAMSKVFRAKFMAALKGKVEIPKPIREVLFKKDWVVYAKRPFGNTASVLEYLGRYSHKVAISNSRIRAVTADEVLFEYKDYKAKGTKKLMSLRPEEFIRRFSQHILPRGFCKIRHYGVLSSSWKKVKLKKLQAQLKAKIPEGKPTQHRVCPCCKVGKLHTILAFDQRGPPAAYRYLLKTQPTPSQA
jgi:Putative transposase/Transposase zinc-binding domain